LNRNEDGTFEQTFQLKGDPNVVRRAGKWELKEMEGETVLLYGALIIDDVTGKIDSELSKSEGAWIMHVDSTFGRFRFPVNEDLGLYFEKTDH
jgi:hypothetical protein